MKVNEMTMEAYEAPMVEVFEVEVEKGFANSGEPDGDGEGEADDFIRG